MVAFVEQLRVAMATMADVEGLHLPADAALLSGGIQHLLL